MIRKVTARAEFGDAAARGERHDSFRACRLRLRVDGGSFPPLNPEAITSETSLAAHLVCQAEESSPDSYYRLARIVARVLLSQRLRERRKWCDLARELAARPEVEERLVRQAIPWFERRSA